MEIIFALAIGVLTGSGVWLLLRPRTFQVIMGLALLSYAVNLFIFGMGRLVTRQAADHRGGDALDLALYADPVPQALVLTAIVISFRDDRIVSRGAAGCARADGHRSCRRPGVGRMIAWLQHLLVVPDRHAAHRGRARCCCSVSARGCAIVLVAGLGARAGGRCAGLACTHDRRDAAHLDRGRRRLRRRRLAGAVRHRARRRSSRGDDARC